MDRRVLQGAAVLLLGPGLAEERKQQGSALVGQDAGCHGAFVIQGRVGVEQVDPTTGSPTLFVGAAENNPLRPAVDDGAGTPTPVTVNDGDVIRFVVGELRITVD